MKFVVRFDKDSVKISTFQVGTVITDKSYLIELKQIFY